jgi:O-acetyl-ADP-ribose deacetylase (regulator of RNase III)
MSDVEMHASATAIIMLGRGRTEDDGETYAEKCADAARWLANAEAEDTARAVRGLSDNRESNGALFVADALKALAKVAMSAGLLSVRPEGNA